MGWQLYPAAEAYGLGATGIGTFCDDVVHPYLDLTPKRELAVCHFAIGHPVNDLRVSV